MLQTRSVADFRRSGLLVVCVLAAARLLLYCVVNRHYGFHRDELATLDDAHYLAWGYVAYPPLTPFIARLALSLFGSSLVGFRFFAALAQCIVMVLVGMMARELGGSRRAVVLAAVATGIAPVSLAAGTLLQYVSFDFLWWVVIAYLMIRLLKSDDARWWLAIGATIGIGMMTKYTVGFYVAGIVVGSMLTPTRRHLKSPWLWAGVLLSLLLFLPNLIWQIQHHFISLDFLRSIHERDVRLGRTDSYLLDQIKICCNAFTLPLVIAGLYFYLAAPDGREYRLLSWMFLVPFLFFLFAKGRGYYMAPAYPMLIAAGSVRWERWLASLSRRTRTIVRSLTWTALVIGGALAAAVAVPAAPINSTWWKVASTINGDFKEEVGWRELVHTTAQIYSSLPQDERSHAGILAGNYGEAGAINLYGPAYGLPKAISPTNSYWLRGYGNPPPQTVIVLGLSQRTRGELFESCELAGHTTNDYGVMNEETIDHPEIFVCRGLRKSWEELWKNFRYFG